MKARALIFLLSLALAGMTIPAGAQQSDYQVKKTFEETYKSLFSALETATTIAVLDSLKAKVDTLEAQYASHAEFLDKAIFPESFAERISSLRTMHSISYDRAYLIQTQGVKIEELETKILFLTAKLDTLTAQRNRLMSDLQEAKKSNQQLRDLVRRMETNLAAKDRLIFALVDSIFQPYARDTAGVTDLQKEAISRKLEKANVLMRIEEVAGENARFLSVTQLQPKDYSSAVDQYQQFSGRWSGLRDKLVAAVLAGSKYGTATGSAKTGKGGAAVPPSVSENPAARVDSLLTLWSSRLQTMFWQELGREFTNKGITVDPFNDGPSFSAGMRKYITSLKASGGDPNTFVNDIWKARIDKEWREALVKPAML
jgi:outer membrane murein-binding lipoprotein Lpp